MAKIISPKGFKLKNLTPQTLKCSILQKCLESCSIFLADTLIHNNRDLALGNNKLGFKIGLPKIRYFKNV
jgi:hypothetical protein